MLSGFHSNKLSEKTVVNRFRKLLRGVLAALHRIEEAFRGFKKAKPDNFIDQQHHEFLIMGPTLNKCSRNS